MIPRVASVGLGILFAASALAQRGGEVRKPKTAIEANRTIDDVWARKQAEASSITARKRLRTSSLRKAMEAAREGEAPSDLALIYDQFMTANGVRFVALHAGVSQSLALESNQAVTLFGACFEGASEMFSFEEPVRVEQSNGELFVSASLAAPERPCRLIVGLATRGNSLAMTRIELDLPPLERDQPRVSNLILSDHIYALEAAQRPDAPFSFGGTRVVPKAKKTFQKVDLLWFFAEFQNPGSGPEGSPDIRMKLEVEGPAGSASKRISASTQKIAATPLKGNPGHFGVGSSLDLIKFATGEYEIRVTLTDAVRGSSELRKQTFQVVDQ